MSVRTPYSTGTAIASGSIVKGAAIRISKGANKTAVATVVTSGIAHGFAAADAVDGGVVNFFQMGGFGLARVAGAISDVTVPLKLTTGGHVIPVTSNNDVICGWAMETITGTSVSLVEIFISPAYYGV